MDRLKYFMQKIRLDVYPEPESDIHSDITKSVIETLLDMLKRGDRVLDIGYGTGLAHGLFKDAGLWPTSITISQTEYDSAVRKGHHVIICDQSEIILSDAQFDLVYARHVLEHSIIPYYTLYEYARLAKAGALIYIEVPAPGTSSRHETNRNHYSVLTNKAWQSLITRAGIEIVESSCWKFQTPNGPDMYFSYICKKLKECVLVSENETHSYI